MAQPFVIQLDNRPGELAHLARALATRGISIRHLAGSSAGKQMAAMLETDDDQVTREVLQSMGMPFVEGDTLVVEVEDRPGALADFSERLGRAGVNITGILVAGCHDGMCEFQFSVDDEQTARDELGLPRVHTVGGTRQATATCPVTTAP